MPEAAAAAAADLPARAEIRARARTWLAAGVLGATGAALLPALVEMIGPAAAGPGGAEMVLCPSHALLGLPCPGCGMTRALAALLGGKPAAAFALHPWAIPLAAQAALGWGVWGWSLHPAAPASIRPASWLGPALLTNLAALAALWLGRLATGSLP